MPAASRNTAAFAARSFTLRVQDDKSEVGLSIEHSYITVTVDGLG